MGRKQRKTSDLICTRLLESIRFAPISIEDGHTTGLHTEGFGGLGYSYWRSEKILESYAKLNDIREVLGVDISFAELKRLFDGFCSSTINPMIAGQFHWQIGGGSLNDRLSDEERACLLSNFVSHCTEFKRCKWYWFALNSIREENYVGENLIIAELPISPKVSPERMAEFVNKPMFQTATMYVGIKARNVENAKEMIGVVLGSLFLCMHSRTQYMHTLGKSSTGILSFEDGNTIHSSQAHLPYLSEEIIISRADFPLFVKLEKLLAGHPEDRKIVRALRWINASWFVTGAEQFSLLCQALDAITPSKFESMRAKCDWAYQMLGVPGTQGAIDSLFKKIRSDVVHGDAPSLSESFAYREFLERYRIEPEWAAVEILRKVIVDHFIPEVMVRLHPAFGYPAFIESEKLVFARYGLQYSLPSGFDFLKLVAAL